MYSPRCQLERGGGRWAPSRLPFHNRPTIESFWAGPDCSTGSAGELPRTSPRKAAAGGGPAATGPGGGQHPAQAIPAAPGTVSPSYRTPEQYERSHIRTAHAAAVGRPGRELDGRAGLPDLLSAGGTHLRPVPRLRRQPTAARPRRKRGTDLPGL
ncbi:MAG TPA: hypothetical protein VMV92_31730 [Streptosporangiaceae bacterium]|nr:hypothetical protein [Streptosporangiaceae bacterium]